VLAYCLYHYLEHGPEDLLVDFDAESFRLRTFAWLAEHGYGPGEADALNGAIAAGPGRHPLCEGWGGATVEIVAVPDRG
jgi:hypothetical protein